MLSNDRRLTREGSERDRGGIGEGSADDGRWIGEG